MRIFKKEFDIRLTDGMLVGECIITKVDNSEYGRFVVFQKTGEGSFPYLALFGLLEHAVKFVQSIESVDSKYEYYCLYEKNSEEGIDVAYLNTMGALGWELCAIDTNVTDELGRSFYIYKRLIKYIDNDNYESPIEDNHWKASKSQLELRDTLKSRVDDYKFIHEDKNTKIMSVHFGKNGLGLTNELSIIGKTIEELSKDNLVYLRDSFIDSCDDVYNLVFSLKPVS